jgi:hypothetical protein
MTIQTTLLIAAVMLSAAVFLSAIVLRPEHRFQIVAGSSAGADRLEN